MSGDTDGSPGRPAPRIGVLYPALDPLDPENWSGSPQGIAAGLRASGAQVVPLGTPRSGPGRVALTWSRLIAGSGAVAARSRRVVAARTRALRSSVAAAGPLDALVAMGTDLYHLDLLHAGVPTVTFDDGTLFQQWCNASSDIRNAGFEESVVAGWFATQARSARAADACCVSTSWAARSFREDYGVPAARLQVVGMGHRPRASQGGIERDWSTPRYLFVGIDWQRKNGDAVLRAFRQVRSRVPGATLDVVGGHPALDEPGVVGHGLLARDDLRAQAQLDLLFRVCTAFVMPSRFDPSPIAYLEAASAGLPVVATTEGGAGELLGSAAVSVHPEDDDAILAAMLDLADPAVARPRGDEARRRSEGATWQAVASRVLAAALPDRYPSERPVT